MSRAYADKKSKIQDRDAMVEGAGCVVLCCVLVVAWTRVVGCLALLMLMRWLLVYSHKNHIQQYF